MKRILTLTVSIILFIELLDTTILYACFVPIADNFGVNPSRLSLPVLSYIVGTCLLIPMSSWMAGRFNRIKLMMVSLLLFSIFSLLCGMSADIDTFSLFRFLQGVTISMSGSIGIIALLSTSQQNEIVETMGFINVPALVGTAIGPLAGSLFSYYLSWRYAFIINFPVGLMIVYLLNGLRQNPEFFVGKTEIKSRFDWVGFSLISVFLMLASIGLEKFSSSLNWVDLLLIFMSIFFAIIYVFLWARRVKLYHKINHSILNLAVFDDANFVFGVIVNIISRTAMCGMPVLIGIVLVRACQYSVIQAGLYLSIIAIAGIFAKCFTFYLKRIGLIQSTSILSILTSISIIFISPITFWVSNHYFWVPCFLLGFNMSLLFTAINSVPFLSMERDKMPDASNIISIIQQFFIGVGVVTAIAGFQFLINLNDMLKNDFQILCILLSSLMMTNVIIANFFQSDNEKLILELN